MLYEVITLLLSTALVNNVVLVKFLGLCPAMGVSRQMDSAIGMGMATTFVLTLAAAASWMLENWLLAPFGLGYLVITSYSIHYTKLYESPRKLPNSVSTSSRPRNRCRIRSILSDLLRYVVSYITKVG